MAVYGPLGRMVKAAYCGIHPRWRALQTAPLERPAVYLVHHQNLSGPIRAVAHLPVEARVWALNMFLEKEACFDQYYSYTFTQRFGWPNAAAKVTARALSLVIPPLMQSLGAIPVYRKRQQIRTTMERSLTALLAGENILICPDVDYASPSPEMGEVYMGFLKLEQMYFEKAGKHLAFVPVYCSEKRRRLVVGRPVHFTGEGSFRAERKQVAATLRRRMNGMGRRCGDIPAQNPRPQGVQPAHGPVQ